MSAYQSFLKDCDCKSGGIIFRDNIPCCRWCRKPYGHGGMINYEDEHFPKPELIEDKERTEIEVFRDLWNSNTEKHSYIILSKIPIPKEKLPLIKSAIEQTLNNEVGANVFNSILPHLYTEKDLEDAFWSGGRLNPPNALHPSNYKYPTYEDYKNENKKD